jgi:isocitrate lyase
LTLDKKDMHDFHTAIRLVYPDRMFAFGFTGGYDFSKGGYSPDELKSFHSDIAKMGVVWQFQPVWAIQGLSLHARKFGQAFAEGGMSYYMREVAGPAIANMPTDKNGNPTSRGGHLADAFFDVVAGREITFPDPSS